MVTRSGSARVEDAASRTAASEPIAGRMGGVPDGRMAPVAALPDIAAWASGQANQASPGGAPLERTQTGADEALPERWGRADARRRGLGGRDGRDGAGIPALRA